MRPCSPLTFKVCQISLHLQLTHRVNNNNNNKSYDDSSQGFPQHFIVEVPCLEQSIPDRAPQKNPVMGIFWGAFPYLNWRSLPLEANLGFVILGYMIKLTWLEIFLKSNIEPINHQGIDATSHSKVRHSVTTIIMRYNAVRYSSASDWSHHTFALLQ